MTESQPAPRTGHPYHMHDAIYAQPGALRLVARGQGDAIEAAALRLRGLDHVLLTGVGTSWHAALVGELLFARLGGLGLKARAFHAFELASYWQESLGRPHDQLHRGAGAPRDARRHRWRRQRHPARARCDP